MTGQDQQAMWSHGTSPDPSSPLHLRASCTNTVHSQVNRTIRLTAQGVSTTSRQCRDTEDSNDRCAASDTDVTQITYSNITQLTEVYIQNCKCFTSIVLWVPGNLAVSYMLLTSKLPAMNITGNLTTLLLSKLQHNIYNHCTFTIVKILKFCQPTVFCHSLCTAACINCLITWKNINYNYTRTDPVIPKQLCHHGMWPLLGMLKWSGPIWNTTLQVSHNPLKVTAAVAVVEVIVTVIEVLVAMVIVVLVVGVYALCPEKK